MFWAIIVLPRPLLPTSTRLRASGRKSSVRARSMTSRSILVGHDQSKSAIGLNFLISERRSRRSRLRWARSTASTCANCSRIWRGDQRCLVARARKSSTSVATACKPICSSWAGRLLLGIVVVRVGEFIVGLQTVGTNLEGLSFRMAAEIQRRQGSGTTVPAQQEGDRGGARSIAFQGFPRGAPQRSHAIQIQQAEELCGLTED